MSLRRKLATFCSSEYKVNLLLDFAYRRRKQDRQKTALIKKAEYEKAVFGIKIKIVVSLTSFGARFSELPKTLKSFLRQSVKPDAIIVWLDKNETLTDEMLSMQKYGVRFVFKDECLKPHKKYLYALQDFSDSIVITVDDVKCQHFFRQFL